MPSSRSPQPRSDLPARDIAEMRLAELLAGDMCPLCAARSGAEERLIDALLGEAVNDVGVRQRLDRARGFCDRHTRLLPERERARRGGTMGTAILLGSVADAQLESLRALEGRSGRRLGGRVADLQRPVDCPLCADVAAAGRASLVTLVGRMADSAWRAELSRAPLCVDDLLRLWEVAARSDRSALDVWQAIAQAQRARIEALIGLARDYVAHNAHDRSSELTEEERSAADRLVALLAGAGERSRG